MPPTEFLQRLHDQIHVSGCRGAATGRNIHQKGTEEAVRMAAACSLLRPGCILQHLRAHKAHVRNKSYKVLRASEMRVESEAKKQPGGPRKK